MIDPLYLGALLCLTAVLLALVVAVCVVAVWLWSVARRFRKVTAERVADGVYVHGSFGE